MPNKIKTERCEWIPGVYAEGISVIVPIHRVPPINKIVGIRADTTNSTETVFLPSTRIVVTENEDGSFAVLNDLEPMRPDLTRIKSSHIEVTILDLESLDRGGNAEDSIRSFYLYVVPNRHIGSTAEIAVMSSKGLYDSLCPIYGSERSEIGKYTAVSAPFPKDQLAKSTFDRSLSEHLDPSEKTKRNAKNRRRKMLARKKKRAEEKAKRKKKNERQERLFGS